MSHHRSLAWTVRLWLRRALVVLLFGCASALLIVFALGYDVNLQHRTLNATGAISLDGNQTGVNITLDTLPAGSALPLTMLHLAPNQIHRVSITKVGYLPWQKNVWVDAGTVSEAGFVRLWPLSPSVNVSAPTDKVALCSANQPSKSDQLRILGGELRTTTRLITRLSQPITDACWFDDQNHVAYLNGDVHIVEVDGTNDSMLYHPTQPISDIAVSRGDEALFVHTINDTWLKIEL